MRVGPRTKYPLQSPDFNLQISVQLPNTKRDATGSAVLDMLQANRRAWRNKHAMRIPAIFRYERPTLNLFL